jgi:hypothetical protein
MPANVLPIRLGDDEVLIEVVQVAGTQNTARPSDAAAKVLDAFETVKQTIVDMAVSTQDVINRTIESARPDTLEVKFGLNISAHGNVIIAGGSASASISVTLTYGKKTDRNQEIDNGQEEEEGKKNRVA